MAWRSVIGIKVQLSRATERRLRLPADKMLWWFEDEAAVLIRGLPDGAVVPDLGGGRACVYATCFPQARERELRPAGFSELRSWITWAQPEYFTPSTRCSCYMRATSSSHVIFGYADWLHTQRSGQFVDTA